MVGLELDKPKFKSPSTFNLYGLLWPLKLLQITLSLSELINKLINTGNILPLRMK